MQCIYYWQDNLKIIYVKNILNGKYYIILTVYIITFTVTK